MAGIAPLFYSPQAAVPLPSADDIGQQLMAGFGQQGGLGAILANINQLTRPTMGLPSTTPQSPGVLIAPQGSSQGYAPQQTPTMNRAAQIPVMPGQGGASQNGAGGGSSLSSLIANPGTLKSLTSAVSSLFAPTNATGAGSAALLANPATNPASGLSGIDMSAENGPAAQALADQFAAMPASGSAASVLAGGAPAMADVTAGTGAGLQSAADAAYADASQALGANAGAAAADSGAGAGMSAGGALMSVGLAGLLADKMFSGFGPMGIEVPGTDAYNSHVTDMMTGYFQPKDLSQSVVSPTAQGQYANLPANWTGQFGAAGESHYFPSAHGTVVATPQQYQQAMSLFGQAQTGADKNGAKPMNPQALQSFLNYVNGLPAAPAGFSLLNQTGAQFANMTPQQRAGYTQQINSAVQDLLSQGIAPGSTLTPQQIAALGLPS